MFIESSGGNGSYINMGSVSRLTNGANGTFSLKSDRMICRKMALGGALYLWFDEYHKILPNYCGQLR